MMIRLLFFVLALILAAAPAAAQFDRLNAPAKVGRENAITPQLVANARIGSSGKIELAILMKVKPGWHGYWLNPGNAGLPMVVDWDLPQRWSIGPLRYPVPSRLLVLGMVNYVYESDFAVLTSVEVPAGQSGSQLIAAEMRWLACTDEVCVPESGRVELDLPAAGMARPDPRFDQWRRALPRPLSTPARVERDGKRLRIGIPLPANVAVKDPYFFPATEAVVNYDALQSFSRKGDLLIAELVASSPESSRIAGVLSYGEGRGLEVVAVPGPVPAGGEAISEPGRARTGLLAALLGALIGGMILNLMPCVFPILALKALHLARAGESAGAARRDSLAYAAGAIVGTAALGGVLLLIRAGGSAAGWAFQLQDPRTTLLLLLLAVAITLNLLKAFELPVLAGGRAPAGSFGTGALAAFIATPCAGPFMGAALGAALLLPLWSSVLVFAALGLGLALPFVAIAFVPALRRMLPRPGPWMARLQRFLAIPMAATAVGALWLLWRQGGADALLVGLAGLVAVTVLLVGYGFAQRSGRVMGAVVITALALASLALFRALPPAGRGSAVTVPAGVAKWSPAALQAERARGKPVFVYFTADWCLSCKVNEAAAIERSETRRAFRDAGVVVMAGDWTNGDPAIGRFLESRGRAGVPLYLWYAPGEAEPEELPQILTPAMLIARARGQAQTAG